jgi:hypothetical protein
MNIEMTNMNYVFIIVAFFFYAKLTEIDNKIKFQNEKINKIYNKMNYGV